MLAPDEVLNRVIVALVTRAPGRAVALVALALYPGFGLALPLALGWDLPWLIWANLMGVSFAAFIALGWLGVRLDARDRRHLLDWTTELRHLSAEEFEWLVGEMFRREGWKVDETGSQHGPDGNVDLRLSRGDRRWLVQCKRWQSAHVGVTAVRAFAGTLAAEGLPPSAGIFVTLSGYTDSAREEAKRSGLILVDGRELHDRVENVRAEEPCPVCKAAMRLDRSPHGWWFRCVAPGCHGKRDLGRDPARAVELLTEHV